MTDEHLAISNALAQDRTDMALERTLMAADRTLMAWTRTSLSMISFGFTIYKFLQGMKEEGELAFRRPEAPRNFGLALVTLGAVSLAIASYQYWHLVRRSAAASGKAAWTLSLSVACLITLIGVLVLLGMLLRMGPF